VRHDIGPTGLADARPVSKEASVLLAYDYPLLGVFWTLLMFFFFALWIFIVIWCFVDNFRRRDHSGVAKALWLLFIVFVPVLGVLCYLIARPAEVVLE
jgi:quinol-cytochrome oxidoreductase complex cytochrome b subunit